MSQSSLVTYRNLTQNYTRRKEKITKITIHHMAAVWTAKQCVDSFVPPARKASANYCIGYDGSIGQSVLEENRAWTSSSSWNDQQAITIEVSDSKKAEPYPITDKSYKALIALCIDICKRNGIASVYYDGTKCATLTEHRMFASTACPATTIHNMLLSGRIAKDINAGLATPKVKGYIIDGIDYTPVFDPAFYSGMYEDLAKAGLTTDAQVWQHFVLFGMKEARWAHPDFNVIQYRKCNKDLDDVFDEDWEAYFKHYLLCGKAEIQAGKRKPFM